VGIGFALERALILNERAFRAANRYPLRLKVRWSMTRANVMPTRRDIRAIDRTAEGPAAALILGGLLLLICP
jgi:hypothetical protein